MICGIPLLVVHKVSKVYAPTMLLGLRTRYGSMANAVANDGKRKEKGRKNKRRKRFREAKKGPSKKRGKAGEKARKKGVRAEKWIREG